MEDLQWKRQLIELGQLKNWSRRGQVTYAEKSRLLKCLLKAGLCLTGLQGRGKHNALHPVLKPQRFEFAHLPDAFDGFTILHLSDLHADSPVGLSHSLFTKLRDLEVDLCVLTGDYRFGLNGSCERVYTAMEQLVAHVKARHGIVGILGNHDVAEMVPEFERMGIRMLMNESLELRQDDQSIWLMGLDDPHFYGCDDLLGTLAEVPQEAFKVLLVHSPELFDVAAANGIHLYLCGHTHGGQICLPFIGPLITHADCPRSYIRGAWTHKGVSGYTSPGVGCSGVTARFLCPPELVVVELCRSRQLEQAPMRGEPCQEADAMLATVEAQKP